MTPAWFDCLYRAELQHHYGPAAQLAALYCNAHLKEGAKPVSPAAFIPGAEVEPDITDEERRLCIEEGIIPNCDFNAFKASWRGTPSDPDHRKDDPDCRCQWCLSRRKSTK